MPQSCRGPGWVQGGGPRHRLAFPLLTSSPLGLPSGNWLLKPARIANGQIRFSARWVPRSDPLPMPRPPSFPLVRPLLPVALPKLDFPRQGYSFPSPSPLPFSRLSPFLSPSFPLQFFFTLLRITCPPHISISLSSSSFPPVVCTSPLSPLSRTLDGKSASPTEIGRAHV